jgi:hypothetical protein
MRTSLSFLATLGAVLLPIMACGGGSAPSLHGAVSSASTGATSSASTGGAGGGGTGGTGGAGTGTSSTSGTGGASPMCSPALTSVTPSGTADVTYTNQPVTGCFGSPCLCSPAARPFVEHVLACDPIEGGFFLGQGSDYLRVVGRKSGACIVDIGEELEEGVTYSRCTLPLPIAPWPGLAASDPVGLPNAFLQGIAAECQTIGQCCIEPGCPNPCDMTLPAAPVCPTLPQPSCQ